MRRQQYVFVALLRPQASIGNQQVFSSQLFGGNPNKSIFGLSTCALSNSLFVLCARAIWMIVRLSKNSFKGVVCRMGLRIGGQRAPQKKTAM